MKKSVKILLMSIGLFVSNHAFSAYGTFENMKATCYIFKNNQLHQQQSCIYSGMSGRDIEDNTSTDIDQKEFILANGHKIKTTNNIKIAHNSERIVAKEMTVNQNKARIYYRSLSFKEISKLNADKSWNKTLVCYKSKQLDFCYITH
ncbi:hypothetical protein [Moraxella sp. ZY210820]|uniref:hypothetical protein n=1 Tax=unclassified Moraxella TaxID=2685852 RepID=UPI0027311871|nr:hypothetical protein [Moraxella sp. ZY210820]WLF83011.1 hypothetical protein LU301_06910 [Moraxella sp. ZY210820]